MKNRSAVTPRRLSLITHSFLRENVGKPEYKYRSPTMARNGGVGVGGALPLPTVDALSRELSRLTSDPQARAAAGTAAPLRRSIAALIQADAQRHGGGGAGGSLRPRRDDGGGDRSGRGFGDDQGDGDGAFAGVAAAAMAPDDPGSAETVAEAVMASY